MKKLIYVFIVLIIVSCNNRAKKSVVEDAIEMDADYETEIIESYETTPNAFIYEDLSTQKLQEMYDLMSLRKKHPEFEETLKSQLKNYTNEAINISIITESLIKNIKLKDEIIKVSDSVQKMKLYYDVVSNNSIQKDSIWATVTTSTIIFEDKKMKSKKLKFSFL